MDNLKTDLERVRAAVALATPLEWEACDRGMGDADLWFIPTDQWRTYDACLMRGTLGLPDAEAFAAALNFLRTHGEALAGMVDRLAPCLWIQDAYDGSWDTACGNKHVFIHGDSADNLHAFCPYCGGRLIEPNYNDQAMQESRDE